MKIFFLYISFSFILFSQNSLLIEQDHRVYPFLSFMETKGLISLSSTRPYTSSYIKEKLIMLKEKSLSRTEKNYLKSFEMEFFQKNEQKNKIQPIWTFTGLSHSWESVFKTSFEQAKENFLHYNEASNFISGNLKVFSEFFRKNSNATLIGSEYTAFGKLGNFHFSLLKQEFSINDQNKILLDKSAILKNSWTKEAIRNESVSSGDHSRGYIAYKGENSLFHLGRIPFEIGNGESGKFVLNGFQNSIPTSIAFSFNFWKLRYQSLHASLISSELTTIITDSLSKSLSNSYRKTPDKYLVSHRFEIDLFDNFQIHYNELIVYGNRSIDLNYVNPFSFLRPTEHELGDRDNALITLGFKWRFPKYNLMTYHDVLLDEWKISKVFSDWFGNKHGIMNGLTWANYNIQAWFEHVSIRPFTYTHKFEANRYTHDGQNLGYSAGPNSQTFFYKLAYYPSPSWRFWVSHRITHKGLNFPESDATSWNIGGDIFKGHKNENTGSTESITEDVEFLSGRLRTELESQVNIIFEPNYYIKTELNYSYNNFDKNLLRFYFRIQY